MVGWGTNRDPIAALSARSSGRELCVDVVGEGSPLFGSAMGTFVLVSAILEVVEYAQSKTSVGSLNDRCGYAPERDRATTTQLSEELRGFVARKDQLCWPMAVDVKEEIQARKNRKRMSCLPTPEEMVGCGCEVEFEVCGEAQEETNSTKSLVWGRNRFGGQASRSRELDASFYGDNLTTRRLFAIN